MKITAATCIARTVIYHARRIRFLYPGGKTPHSYAINDATREIRKYKTASDTLDHLTPAAGTCPDFISELAILITKAPSILATMSKQHCRTLQVQRFFSNMFDLFRLCRKDQISFDIYLFIYLLNLSIHNKTVRKIDNIHKINTISGLNGQCRDTPLTHGQHNG